ncbi:MAG: hypothetical protein RL572_1920 [Pseudomonadota bacterium]|jgi:hypothetical protein
MHNYIHGLLLGFSIAGALAPVSLQAQTPGFTEARFPQLAQYLNASEVLQAAVFDEIVVSNESSESQFGKVLLMEEIAELSEAEFSHYHTATNHMAMLGPFRVFETRATPGLQSMIRDQFEEEEVASVLSANGSIPPIAVDVLERGRQFGLTLLDIYLDNNVLDKHGAVDQALQDYLSEDSLSVAALPKSPDLLSKHPYAYAFRVGFPQLSGLAWASQWLQIAALEATILSGNDAELEAAIATVQALYEEKVAPTHGSLMGLPTDIPTMPAIAPNVYSFHPGAAYVLDNISLLKVVIGDLLAHPDVPDRAAAIEAAVASYTDKVNNLDDEMKYLEFVLRGGIFNQGGPALGGLVQSERNRGRSATQHVSNYPMR